MVIYYLNMNCSPIFIPQIDNLQLVAGFTLSIVITLVSLRSKAISISGAWGMLVMGTIVFSLGGPIFGVPLVFFFISSSILSAIQTSGKKKTIAISQKSGTRDIWQVLANGGIGTVFVIVYFITGNLIWFFPYLASLCEATSDTWATEIGTLYPDSPISIVTLKSVKPGESGGITWLGTLTAIGGVLATALVAYCASGLAYGLALYDLKFWLLAANCGLVGSLLDSVLGGSVQAQYLCPFCNQSVESKIHCGHDTFLVGGLRFVNNDLVNFASCSFAAISTAIMLFLGFK
jgi:uncharacterized protein (TIGR00297 family)